MNILFMTVVNAEQNNSKDLFIHQIAKGLMWTILTWRNVLSVKFQSEIEQYHQQISLHALKKMVREKTILTDKKTPN